MSKKQIKKVVQTEEKKVIAKKLAKKTVSKQKKAVSSGSKTSKSASQNNGRSVPFMALGVLIGLFIISIFMLFRQTKYASDSIIVHDLQHLQQIFETINKDCKIIDFEHTHNYIDFLTVEKFVGSEVGAMNLSYPENWKGPYLKDNPTVQEQQYIVLKNNSGYYLVPGNGVVLANGKEVGKDIVLNEKTDMKSVLADPQALQSSQGALGIQIPVGGSYFRKIIKAPLRFL